MNVSELECHLVELQSKGMETRGVLRKLILEYSRLGDSKRMKELREQFTEHSYQESAGIKSTILNNHLRAGNLEEATKMYEEIKEIHSSFNLDDYKIVDLATLMVKNGDCDGAIQLIQNESENK